MSKQVDLSDPNLNFEELYLRSNPHVVILGINEYYGDNRVKYYDVTYSRHGIYHRESYTKDGLYYDDVKSSHDIIFKTDFVEANNG